MEIRMVMSPNTYSKLEPDHEQVNFELTKIK